jgi:hypothetical protein
MSTAVGDHGVTEIPADSPHSGFARIFDPGRDSAGARRSGWTTRRPRHNWPSMADLAVHVEHIVVPLDGSEFAERGLAVADGHAGSSGRRRYRPCRRTGPHRARSPPDRAPTRGWPYSGCHVHRPPRAEPPATAPRCWSGALGSEQLTPVAHVRAAAAGLLRAGERILIDWVNRGVAISAAQGLVWPYPELRVSAS